MKAVFISFYQAFYEEVIAILDQQEIRGFTLWNNVQGRGSFTGEPHYGSHAWPTINSAILTFIDDKKVQPLLEELHKLDLSAEQQGIRAFILSAEEYSINNR